MYEDGYMKDKSHALENMEIDFEAWVMEGG